MTTRRLFLMTVTAGGAALGAPAFAQPKPVDPTDPQAVALGYVTEASHADTKKFPKYAAGQACSGCALFQGKPGDAAGACPIFSGRQVSAKGWCSAWAKRP